MTCYERMDDTEILNRVLRLVDVYSDLGMPCETRFKQVYDLIVGLRVEREAKDWREMKLGEK